IAAPCLPCDLLDRALRPFTGVEHKPPSNGDLVAGYYGRADLPSLNRMKHRHHSALVCHELVSAAARHILVFLHRGFGPVELLDRAYEIACLNACDEGIDDLLCRHCLLHAKIDCQSINTNL